MANNPNIKAIHARQKARKKLVQALYQWMITGTPTHEIEEQFAERQPDFAKIDLSFFKSAMKSITMKNKEMEDILEPFLDIKVSQLDEIEKSVLFIGLYELNHHLETPYRVVINESVELAKRFGGTDSHKFINGVMDKLSKDIRTVEHS
jgi:N utilization substance protein B